MGKYQVTQKEYQEVMGTNPSNFKGDNLPVERVSWYDAIVFCNKKSMKEGLTPAYRIHGSTNPVNWGTVPTSRNARWDAVTIVSDSNGYRLPTEAQTDPTGAVSGGNRVLRGGSWIRNGWLVRSAIRDYNSPDFRNSRIGFRLMRY